MCCVFYVYEADPNPYYYHETRLTYNTGDIKYTLAWYILLKILIFTIMYKCTKGRHVSFAENASKIHELILDILHMN